MAWGGGGRGVEGYLGYSYGGHFFHAIPMHGGGGNFFQGIDFLGETHLSFALHMKFGDWGGGIHFLGYCLFGPLFFIMADAQCCSFVHF